MSLILAGNTEGWKFYLRLTNGTFLKANSTDRLRFAGTTAIDSIAPFNNSTHLFAADNVTHICSSIHGQNTKYVSNTTASINGGAATSLPIPQANCPLMLSFFSLEKVVVSGASIYAYDGSIDANGMSGVRVYLAEGGNSTSWTQSNGSGSSLSLAAQPIADEEHNFYIACSTEYLSGSGTSNGAFKILISYV